MISAQRLPARLGGVGRLMFDRLAGQPTNTNTQRNARSCIFLVEGLERYFTVVRFSSEFSSPLSGCLALTLIAALSRPAVAAAAAARCPAAASALRPFRLRPAWLLRRRSPTTSLAATAAAAAAAAITFCYCCSDGVNGSARQRCH